MKKQRLPANLILTMVRFTCFHLFMVMLTFGVSAARNTGAQELLTRTVTIESNNQDIRSVLSGIERNAKVKFAYEPALMLNRQKVSIAAQNEQLSTVLERLLRPLDLTYEVSRRYIIITERTTGSKRPVESQAIPEAIDINIAGRITDEKGEVLPGVNVLLKGTQRGTTSQADGTFTIAVPDDKAVLVFSFVGYLTREIAVGNRTRIDLELLVDNKALEEVVVVGYGTQKKTSVTGAVSSVSGKDLQALPVIGFTQAMQGWVAGVQVTNNGSPGATPIIRVRGVGSVSLSPDPLYVIDGVPAGGINNIDPKDIESLEVLKDASSAAIYGSRAANGVILVTTKKGAAGKLKVNFDTYYGTQSVAKRMDLLNRDQYLQYGTALLTAAGQPVPGRFNNMNTPVYEGASTTFAQTDTDWQDVIFRNAPISDNQLSISGGNEFSRFYTSLGYFMQKGIIQHTDYDRKSFRINSDHKINKSISIGQTLMVAGSSRTAEREGGGRTLLQHTMRMVPYWPVSDPTKLGGYSTTAQGLDATDPDNPMRLIVLEQKNHVDKGVKMVGTVYTDIRLTSWLKYRFTAGLDYSNSRLDGFLPIYNDGNRSSNNATITKNTEQFLSTVFTNALTFEKTFGRHYVNLLAVGERQDATSKSVNASGIRSDNNIKELQGIQSPLVNSSTNENTLLSYVGRLNYEYAGKYLVGASVRRDGSSKFAPGKKWGTFPAFSAGWRISEEEFMKTVGALTELKLRGSWGKSGFNAIGNYDWQALVQANSTVYPLNNNPAIMGSYINAMSNTDLSWEVTTMTNVGVDATFLNNMFNFTAEYYHRFTDGMILAVPLAGSLGYSTDPRANVGSMRNSGFELALGYNYSGKDLRWTLTGTFDITRNRVLNLATPNATIHAGSNVDYGGFDITRTEAGHPIQSFYGWQVEKIFQDQAEINALNTEAPGGFYQNDKTSPGDIKFRDINGDGKITADDRTFLGSYLPKFSYGLNWGGSYRNFDFTVYFQGVHGNKIYNGTNVIGQGMLRLFNATTAVLDAWTPQNTDTNVPRAISGDPNQNSRTSDRFLEDGSYLRLKNLSIGYSIPDARVSSLTKDVLKRVRIYISSQNLLTFTKYTGYDPEVGSRGGGLLTNGVDYGLFPQARTLMVGLNLGF